VRAWHRRRASTDTAFARSRRVTRYNTGMNHPTPAPESGIDRAKLLDALLPATRDWTIEIVESTGSTNTDLHQRLRAARDLALPLVRVAYLQSAGRGRRGRQWVAAAGDALMFSLAYPIQRPLAELGGLSLAVGTAILDGLRALKPSEPSQLALKWPNDILLSGAKLGGVLIETAWSDANTSAVVIGIGLNLRGAQALAGQLDKLAGGDAPANSIAALESVLAQPTLTATLAALLNALAPALTRFGQTGFAAFRDAWLANHAYAGLPVVLLENGTELARGTADSIDAQGQLLLTAPDGSQYACAAGDVSLRLRAGVAH